MKKNFKKMAMLLAFSMTMSATGSLSCVKVNADSKGTTTVQAAATAKKSGATGAGALNSKDSVAGAMVTGDVIINEEKNGEVDSLKEYYAEVGASVKSTSSDFPSSLDNTTLDTFPEIGKQEGSSCGCWADVYYAATNTINKARGTAAKRDGVNIESNVLSPEFVYNQTRTTADTSGGTYSTHNSDFLVKYGAPNLDYVETANKVNWEYAWNASEETWMNALENKMSSYYSLGVSKTSGDKINTKIYGPKDPSLNVIKKALNDGNVLPFSAYFYLWQNDVIDSEAHKGESIYYACDKGLITSVGIKNESGWGAHRMTVVGYDDNI